MKWSIFVCLVVCLARFCDAFALKCPPGLTDPSCTEERKEDDTHGSIGGASEILLASDSGSELRVSEDSTHKSENTDVVVPKVTLSRKVRAFTEPPKTCQPGQEFRMDCNKCLCDNKGVNFSCTRNDCNILNGHTSGTRSKRDTSEQLSMECIPGSVFNRDCNACRCAENGHFATCSIKPCKNPELEYSNDADLGFRCIAGDQFRRDCNDCICAADGRSVSCTLRLCDENLMSGI